MLSGIIMASRQCATPHSPSRLRNFQEIRGVTSTINVPGAAREWSGRVPTGPAERAASPVEHDENSAVVDVIALAIEAVDAVPEAGVGAIS